MSEPAQLSEGKVVRTIAQRDRSAFALFLGAGASRSSGVALAGEMVEEWRRLAYAEACMEAEEPDQKTLDAWCAGQPWFDKDHEYSSLFEHVCHDSRSRQRYIEGKVNRAFPSWGYLYLANLIQHDRFNVIFTTNFDDLVNEALALFLGYNAVVCGVDAEVATINLTSERAKIVKLHGDYLFDSFMKNTRSELQQLDTNMQRKFKQFAVETGLVVVGYNGWDESIMRVIEDLMAQESAFPHGVYWGVRPDKKAAPRVQKLAEQYPQRFWLFTCADFDGFMARLHENCGEVVDGKATPLPLPGSVVEPYDALRKRYLPLLSSVSAESLPIIREDAATLDKELNRPWAKARKDEFDLLQAQIALGRRDYKAALEVVEEFVRQHPGNADGFTAWGDALYIRADEEGSSAFSEEAVAKWQEAIRLDPAAPQPRYSLARFYTLKQRFSEAIVACEGLMRVAPNDFGVRRNLASLYGIASRYDEAEAQLAWLLAREPKSADLHALRASLFQQRGLVPQAIDAVRTAISLAPEMPWFHFFLAGELGKTNRLEEAAAAFEEAIRLDARNLNFRLQAAQFYMLRQQPARALPHLQTAVSIGPNSAEAHGWLAEVLLTFRDIDTARREAQTALQLSPHDSRIHIVAGNVSLQSGQWQQAETHFAKAIEANPGAPQGYAMLCTLYQTQGRVAEAHVVLGQLAQINPQAAHQLQTQFRMMPPPSGAGAADWSSALQNQLRSWFQPPGGRATPPPIPDQWRRE